MRAAETLTHSLTHSHTHGTTTVNPRCACAPRVNNYQHRLYCILAISTILVLVLLPTLLQLLYPMLWFQRLLNRLRLNSPGLRLCMESFQGYYRDRTDGGWDCRYFSTAYPTIRVIFYVASGTVHTFNMFAICNVHHCWHYPHSQTIQAKVQGLPHLRCPHDACSGSICNRPHGSVCVHRRKEL